MAVISALPATLSAPTSHTFMTLPRSGKTPYRWRPTTLRPATADALALSPSVRMSVHWPLLAVPAHSASSSLGTTMVARLAPSVFLASLSTAAPLSCTTRSTRPSSLKSLSPNASLSSTLAPNWPTGVVSVSLDCESKRGPGTVARTKTIRLSRTYCGLATTPLRRAAMRSQTLRHICATTWSTCLPPRRVETPLTNETCCRPVPSPRIAATSHPSHGRSYALPPPAPPKRST